MTQRFPKRPGRVVVIPPIGFWFGGVPRSEATSECIVQPYLIWAEPQSEVCDESPRICSMKSETSRFRRSARSIWT